jgi:hypothetical protein
MSRRKKQAKKTENGYEENNRWNFSTENVKEEETARKRHR